MEDWTAAMRAGDFERAWAISDVSLARLRRRGLPKHEGPRHQQRIWRGEELSGRTVLIRCYHGLGDTIQFIRFARPLHAIARSVIVWCQGELVSLVSGVDGVDLALPLHDGAPDVAFDVDIEIMEIPHAIRARHDQVAMANAYLHPPTSVPQNLRWSECLSIGLVWQTSQWDVRRSFPVHELRQLDLPGTQLYSLQIGAAAKDAASIGAIDISAPDLATLAGRLRALDLVICPDSMVAHLAAALGCQTWIVLPADCDWRWPDRGSRTLWYPTATLFHQDRDRGWHGVFTDVGVALASYLKRWRSLTAGLPPPSSGVERAGEMPAAAGASADTPG
jgi:hypothetical protein